ncbi:ABC transporter ATP-binding protein [Neisseria elongata subsp. glycolytica]|nr:ABC transporter ATP-binding protein [Neisseria elongata subsp. glycolytica]
MKLLDSIFSWFENRIDPYPEHVPPTPDAGLFRFIWSCIDGVRGWILVLAVCSAVIGILEAVLFQFVGEVVDWLGKYSPETLLAEKGAALTGMGLLLAFFIVWRFFASNVRLQTLQGVFPMRLRWNFHRQMLNQSLGFYQDEFAGRVSAKVMQTALAVRETVMTIADMVVYVLVYFLTSGVILATLDRWLLAPFIGWAVLFFLLMKLLIPRLAKTAQRQADARSMMTGRITDAYSNIATVKLFSHGAREARYAKESMEEFMQTVHAQMRLASLLSTLSFAVNALLIFSTTALGIWLWIRGEVGVGAVAVATTMALRVNGLSQYIMWESAMLFENIGTVTDGMGTLSKPQTILDNQRAQRRYRQIHRRTVCQPVQCFLCAGNKLTGTQGFGHNRRNQHVGCKAGSILNYAHRTFGVD